MTKIKGQKKRMNSITEIPVKMNGIVQQDTNFPVSTNRNAAFIQYVVIIKKIRS